VGKDRICQKKAGDCFFMEVLEKTKAKQTLSSLAILKVNWDYNKTDYLDNFVPFIANLIVKEKYTTIDITQIREDFECEFGLRIPHYPMISIINRAKTKKLIFWDGAKHVPNREIASSLNFTKIAIRQRQQQEKIITEIIKFAKERKYNLSLEREEIYQAFISFLKNYDQDLLFLAHTETILPVVKDSQKHTFLVYKFIQHAFEAEPNVFEFIVSAAIGHILANTILFNSDNISKQKWNNVGLYFDTKFMLRLLGVEGDERKAVAQELIKSFKNAGAKFFIFEQNFNEIRNILSGCLSVLENCSYDPTKASLTLKYFVQKDFEATDVEQLIISLPDKISKIGIKRVTPSDPNIDTQFQIDENKLYQTILELYKKRDPSFDEDHKRQTILNDVKSISSIYKLRKGTRELTISGINSVFVTTNNTLAYASKRYDSSEFGNTSLPSCLTDIFIGTLLWLQDPATISQVNTKKIIADCYAALQPDGRLVEKFIKQLEKLRKIEQIDNKEYYLLRTHRVAMNLLEEKTMGDPDSFLDQTPEEILDEIRKTLRQEEKNAFLKDKKNYENELKVERKRLQKKDRDLKKITDKLNVTKTETDNLMACIRIRAEDISKTITNVFTVLIIGMFIFSFLIQIRGNIFGITLEPFELYLKRPKFATARTISIIVTGLLGMSSMFLGLNLLKLHNKIKNKLSSLLIGFMINRK